MGVRRFDQPEDVADFVASVFLEVLRSAGRFDPTRGHAVAWLYGVGSNVAAVTYRQQARALRAGQRCRAVRSWTQMITPGGGTDRRGRRPAACVHRDATPDEPGPPDAGAGRVDGLTAVEAARALAISPVAARVRRHGKLA